MVIIKNTVTDDVFTRLYNDYYSDIFRYCLARLNCNRDYAEDCTQETFIVLYKKICEGEIFENPRAFLFKTATNFVKKKYREIESANKTVDIEDAEYMLTSNDYDALDSIINYGVITKKINSILNKDETALYTMRFVDGMQVKEIAANLNITPANCSLRITRLRRKIIKEIQDYI